MRELRQTVQKVILAIGGLIVVTLLIRFFLILIAANSGSWLVSLILDLTNPLVSPFYGIGLVISIGVNIEVASIVAIIFYIVLSILLVELITSFLRESLSEIMINLLDAFFKIIEFILITRLVLRLFGIPATAAPFVATIYNSTGWTQGILPSVPFMSGSLEFSTLAVLVVIAVLDLAMEGLIASLIKPKRKPTAGAGGSPAASSGSTVVHNTFTSPAPAPAQHAAPQNITINVPMMQPQRPAPTRQVINVLPPPNRR